MMKRILVRLTLLLAALFAQQAEAQYGYVQKAENDSASGSQTTINTGAFSASTTTDNWLAGMVCIYGTDPGTITISGGGVTTFTKKAQFGDASNGFCTVFYGKVTVGATTAVTADFTNAGNFPAIVAGEYSGLASTSPEVGYTAQIDTTQSTTTDETTSGDTATLTAQPAAVIGFAITVNTSAISTGTGFNDRGNWADYGGGAGVGGAVEDKRVTSTAATSATFTLGSNDNTAVAVLVLSEPAYTLEHEGFRWGVDDGSESAHTFEAAQDTNISIADSQSRLLRTLVNATGDPASAAYTLRYQKNGSGGYAAVPVGSSSRVTPVIEAADATESGNNTASASWAVNYPNASTGDLLIFCIAWDDSTATTDVTEPAGPNSEVLSEINATPATDAATETRAKCWYTKATGTWTASTLTFTPAASEQWTAAVVHVPSGEFDSTTPIGGSGVNNTAGTADTNVLNAAFTAGSSDGSGKLLTFSSVDTDPMTVASGWTQIANTDRGAVAGGVFSRDTAVTDSESITAGTVATIASDSWASVSFVVRPLVITNEVYITTSANIAAGGEATTARLTAPSGKTTGDFVTGRRWDDENGSDATDVTTDDYTEVEWLVFIAASAADGDFFDFRTYADSNALNTYTLTPRWTIPSSGASGLLLRRRRQ